MEIHFSGKVTYEERAFAARLVFPRLMKAGSGLRQMLQVAAIAAILGAIEWYYGVISFVVMLIAFRLAGRYQEPKQREAFRTSISTQTDTIVDSGIVLLSQHVKQVIDWPYFDSRVSTEDALYLISGKDVLVCNRSMFSTREDWSEAYLLVRANVPGLPQDQNGTSNVS